MKYVKIDQDGFFVSVYDMSEIEQKPIEEVLVGWDESGGPAAAGKLLDMSDVQKIPSDSVYTDVPEQKSGYKAKWNNDHWTYIDEITGEEYKEPIFVVVEEEPLEQQVVIEEPGIPFQ